MDDTAMASSTSLATVFDRRQTPWTAMMLFLSLCTHCQQERYDSRPNQVIMPPPHLHHRWRGSTVSEINSSYKPTGMSPGTLVTSATTSLLL
jgi:hypothetical protein